MMTDEMMSSDETKHDPNWDDIWAYYQADYSLAVKSVTSRLQAIGYTAEEAPKVIDLAIESGVLNHLSGNLLRRAQAG